VSKAGAFLLAFFLPAPVACTRAVVSLSVRLQVLRQLLPPHVHLFGGRHDAGGGWEIRRCGCQGALTSAASDSDRKRFVMVTDGGGVGS
jgi:hypothetical protein